MGFSPNQVKEQTISGLSIVIHGQKAGQIFDLFRDSSG